MTGLVLQRQAARWLEGNVGRRSELSCPCHLTASPEELATVMTSDLLIGELEMTSEMAIRNCCRRRCYLPTRERSLGNFGCVESRDSGSPAADGVSSSRMQQWH